MTPGYWRSTVVGCGALHRPVSMDRLGANPAVGCGVFCLSTPDPSRACAGGAGDGGSECGAWAASLSRVSVTGHCGAGSAGIRDKDCAGGEIMIMLRG